MDQVCEVLAVIAALTGNSVADQCFAAHPGAERVGFTHDQLAEWMFIAAKVALESTVLLVAGEEKCGRIGLVRQS